MENENGSPTGNADATPLDRIQALLDGDSPQDESDAQEIEQKAEAPETEAEEKPDVKGEEEEAPEYELSDLADLLGTDANQLDVDESGKILVKTKIDGEEGRVKLNDLIKDYQLKGHAEKTVREAAEIRKQAIEQAQAVQQQIQVQQQIVGKIAEIKSVEAEFQQYRGIDLDRLIDQDPVQALKVQRHMQALQERHAALTNEAHQAANYVQQQQVHVTQATLQQEAQALMQALPDWTDSAKAEREKTAIKADLKARGYTDRDIAALSDHKAVLLARDAMLYRQMQTAGKSVEKQVRNAPKIVRPGTTQSRGTQSTVSKIKAEVRNGGGKSAFENYLLATGKL